MPLIPVDGSAAQPIKLKTGTLVPADDSEPKSIKLKTGTLIPADDAPKNPNLIDQPLETLAKSGGEFFGSILSAIGHPIQTAKALGGLAVGTAQKAIPGKQEQEKYIDALAVEYADRYGGFDNAKKTILEDPIGVMSDLSIFLGGGGAALKGAGRAGKLAKVAAVGESATKAASMVDPLAGTMKLAGKGIEAATSGRRIAPFASKLNQQAIRAAKETGVELPASAQTTSRIVPIAESVTAKGYFGRQTIERVENAYKQMNVVADDVVAKTGKSPDLSTAGMEVYKGAEAYRNNFFDVKNKLYDEATIPRDGKIIEVDPSKSLEFVDEILSNKREASELLGSAQDIQYFENLRNNLKIEKTFSDRRVGDYLEEIFDTRTVNVPLSGRKVNSAIKELNQKINNISDPVATGNKAALKKLAALLSDDLDDAIVSQRPDLADAITKANSFYSEGINKLNSAYGEKIFNLGKSGQFDKIVPAIANKSTSIDDIPKIFEIIGKDKVPALQSAFLDEFFNVAKNTDDKFTPMGLSKQIDRYGEQKLAAILTPDQLKAVKNLAEVSKSLGPWEKMSQGSQTAFISRVIAETTALVTNPWLGVKLILGDALFSRFIGSRAGQDLLTKGKDLTGFGQRAEQNLSKAGEKIGQVGRVARTAEATN